MGVGNRRWEIEGKVMFRRVTLWKLEGMGVGGNVRRFLIVGNRRWEIEGNVMCGRVTLWKWEWEVEVEVRDRR